MWIGEIRKSGEVPAWSFVVQEKATIEGLKGILQKVVIETKTRNMKGADSKEEDANWLQAAVIADDDDINMSENDDQSSVMELSEQDLEFGGNDADFTFN